MSRRWRGAERSALPGRRWDAPPRALAVNPGIRMPVRLSRRTLRPELHRHGRRWDAPPAATAVAPGTWIPVRIVRNRIQPEFRRRGHRWEAPPIAIEAPVVWNVSRVNRRTQRPEIHRRGHRWDAPTEVVIPGIWVPGPVKQHRILPPIYRRGCRWDAPPLALAVNPGVRMPIRQYRRTQRPELHKRGRRWDALYQPVASQLRPTIDVVAIALVRQMTTIPAANVDALLPKNQTLWVTAGFIQTFGVQETSGMYVPLHASIAMVHGWATAANSGKPPWGKASQLLEQLKMKCYQSTAFPTTLDLSSFGNYKRARVHNAYFVGEPRRVPADDGSFAHYEGELLIHWTPED